MSQHYSLLTPAPTVPERLSAQGLWKVLRARWWVIVLLAVAGFVTALGFSSRLPKLYTASGAIAVGGQSFTIPELQGALRANDNDPMLLVRTEEQALSARQLVEKVVVQLNLADRKEFNSALNSPGVMAQATAYFNHLLQAEDSLPQSGSPDQNMVGVVNAAIRAMSVFNDNRSLVITLGFTSNDPVLSANFINTLIGDYRAERSRQHDTADESAKRTLGEQIEQLNGEIGHIDQQVQDLQEQGQLVTLRAGGVGQQQLEVLAEKAVQAHVAYAQLNATFQRVTALAAAGATADYSGALTSETIVRLRDQEATAARRLADMATRYGPDYPALRDAQANLGSVRALLKQEDGRIVSSLAAQLDVAKQQEVETQAQLDAARDQAVRAQSIQAHVDALKRQVADRRTLVQQLQQRSQQTIAPASSQVLDVRELIRAEPPATPTSPKKGLASALGGLAGGMLGLLLVIGRTRQVVRGSPSVTASGLPVFAALPARYGGPRSNLLSLVHNKPAGEEAEALRMLRTRIRLSANATNPRVVAFITVHSSQEGAEIAAAFADLAAADGERTLLIETDLQTPLLARIFDIKTGELPAVLRGEVMWRDAIVRNTSTGLDMLLAHVSSPAAHPMLSGVRFQSLLAETSENYNLIVLSGPPLRNTADALTVAHRADASVLILDAHPTDEATINSFTSDLMRVSFGPAGALLLAAR